MHYDAQGQVSSGRAPAYRASSRLKSDSCEIDARDLQNESYRDRLMFYGMLHDHAGSCEAEVPARGDGPGGGTRYVSMREIADFSTDNLLALDAGATRVRPECVDTDSALRYGTEITCAGERQPLSKRLFVAVPDLYRGQVDLEVESRLVQGEHGARQVADRGRSVYEYRRMPMLDCLARTVQDPRNIVMDGPRGGASTRESACGDDP